MVDWLERAFIYIPNDTQMVSWSFDVSGITTTDSSKVRRGSLYKSCLENDEEEDELFVLWFYTVIPLGSLEKKQKQKLKKLFIYYRVIENI